MLNSERVSFDSDEGVFFVELNESHYSAFLFQGENGTEINLVPYNSNNSLCVYHITDQNFLLTNALRYGQLLGSKFRLVSRDKFVCYSYRVDKPYPSSLNLIQQVDKYDSLDTCTSLSTSSGEFFIPIAEGHIDASFFIEFGKEMTEYTIKRVFDYIDFIYLEGKPGTKIDLVLKYDLRTSNGWFKNATFTPSEVVLESFVLEKERLVTSLFKERFFNVSLHPSYSFILRSDTPFKCVGHFTLVSNRRRQEQFWYQQSQTIVSREDYLWTLFRDGNPPTKVKVHNVYSHDASVHF